MYALRGHMKHLCRVSWTNRRILTTNTPSDLINMIFKQIRLLLIILFITFSLSISLSAGSTVSEEDAWQQTENAIDTLNEQLPKQTKLLQNYPNPFNPVTNIQYEVGVTSDVRLEIFDTMGRRVAFLVDKRLEPGSYATLWEAGNYASGIYIIRLITRTNQGKKLQLTARISLVK